MTLVQRSTASGLVLAELASDEAAVARALKAVDDRLALWPPDGLSPYYRVVRAWSDSHPATIVVTWMDPNTRDPLPLSSGLIDEVQKWRPESRSRRGPDSEEINARQRETARRLHEDTVAEISEEHRAKIDRGRVTVGIGTRTTKPFWLRNSHLPDSVRKH